MTQVKSRDSETKQVFTYNVVQIISEHKKRYRNNPVPPGHKRVEAIVKYGREPITRHIDIPRDFVV